jgi:hypothetical protein
MFHGLHDIDLPCKGAPGSECRTVTWLVDGERDAEGDGDDHDVLERALVGEESDDHGVEGEGGQDSDSSLDLHTPLP